jgi:hypothetical protein
MRNAAWVSLVAFVLAGCWSAARVPVKVESNLVGGEILVDGEAAGARTPATIVLSTGRAHTIVVVAPDGRRSPGCRVEAHGAGLFGSALVQVAASAALIGPGDVDEDLCFATFDASAR